MSGTGENCTNGAILAILNLGEGAAAAPMASCRSFVLFGRHWTRSCAERDSVGCAPRRREANRLGGQPNQTH